MSIKPKKKSDTITQLANSPKLVKKIREARKEIKDGKRVKMDVKNLWK